jgi:hypothetical protein
MTTHAEKYSNGNGTNETRFPMKLSNLFPDLSQQDEKVWKSSFSFVHACDPQLGLIEKHILKLDEPGWKVDAAHLKCAVKMTNEIRPKPKFMIIGGDMVHTPPYTDQLDVHIAQYKDFQKCFEDLDPEIKLIFVSGNHDVGDFCTLSTMDIYRDEFGADYFSFWQGGVKFTVLNSQYFKAPDVLEMESFQQMDFLKNLKKENAVHHGT